jgi:hypothetical protein
MNNISETLRRERLKQGLDLQKLSDITKISTRMLQAMEVGDLSKLPGGVFTRSFFKQYAIALGLDPAALEAEIRQLSPEPEQALDPRAGEPTFTPFGFSDPRFNSLTVASVWVLFRQEYPRIRSRQAPPAGRAFSCRCTRPCPRQGSGVTGRTCPAHRAAGHALHRGRLASSCPERLRKVLGLYSRRWQTALQRNSPAK